MLLLDAILRFPTLTILAILLALVLRDAGRSPTARIAAALCVALIGYSVETLPPQLSAPGPIETAASFLAVPVPALIWLFCMALLKDEFRIGFLEIAVVGVICAFKLSWALEAAGWSAPLHSVRYAGTYVVTLGALLHIAYCALAGLKDDLVKARRRSRVLITSAIAAAGGLNLALELVGWPRQVETLFGHALALTLLISALFWLVSLRPNALGLLKPVSKANTADAGAVTVSAKDRPAYRRLMAQMTESKAFLDPDLSIASLAAQVGVPAHQLRTLINTVLGHRNFSTFVNGYRLAHAKALLADPETLRTPILTIALDSGFPTLSTFNRTFKAFTSETPSAFRSRVCEGEAGTPA